MIRSNPELIKEMFLKNHPEISENDIFNIELFSPFEIIIIFNDGVKVKYDAYYDTEQFVERNAKGKNNLKDEDIIKQDFSRRLIRAMRMKNISQEQLSKITNISISSIKKYCAGYLLPGSIALYKICKALDCSTEYFFYVF